MEGEVSGCSGDRARLNTSLSSEASASGSQFKLIHSIHLKPSKDWNESRNRDEDV